MVALPTLSTPAIVVTDFPSAAMCLATVTGTRVVEKGCESWTHDRIGAARETVNPDASDARSFEGVDLQGLVSVLRGNETCFFDSVEDSCFQRFLYSCQGIHTLLARRVQGFRFFVVEPKVEIGFHRNVRVQVLELP